MNTLNLKKKKKKNPSQPCIKKNIILFLFVFVGKAS